MSHRRPRSLLTDLRRQHELLERPVRDLTVLLADVEQTRGELPARYATALGTALAATGEALARLREARAHLTTATEAVATIVPEKEA